MTNIPTQNSPTAPCKLEDRETSGQKPAPLRYNEYKRSFHREEFHAVRQAYIAYDLSETGRHVNQLNDCRSKAWFARNSETGKVRVVSHHCHLRWCPMCAASRQAFITHQVGEWFKAANYPKLITLTLKHSSAPVSHQTSSLYGFFRKLRKNKFWRTKVTGGVWFFQLTWNQRAEQFHPHLHILASGKFINSKQLSRYWLMITGNSKIVHVRPIKNRENAVAHVARYAAKPCNLVNFPSEIRLNIINALHSRRICGTFGNAKNVSLRPCKPDDSAKWVNVGSWTFVTELRGFEDIADKIFNAWKNDEQLGDHITLARKERHVIDDIPEAPQTNQTQRFLSFYDSCDY